MPDLDALICIRKLSETTYISYFTLKGDSSQFAHVYMEMGAGRSTLLWNRSQHRILRGLRAAELVVDKRDEFDWILAA
jgi:hypothetical protein